MPKFAIVQLLTHSFRVLNIMTYGNVEDKFLIQY